MKLAPGCAPGIATVFKLKSINIAWNRSDSFRLNSMTENNTTYDKAIITVAAA